MKKLIATLLLSAFLAPSALASDGQSSGDGQVRKGLPLKVFELIAEYLGIDKEELKTELQSGSTFYEIAIDQGVDPVGLDQYLKKGKNYTKKILQDAKLLEKLATALGITVEDLKVALSAGTSVKDLAAAHNVDMDDIKAIMGTNIKVRIENGESPRGGVPHSSHNYAHPKPAQALANDSND